MRPGLGIGGISLRKRYVTVIPGGPWPVLCGEHNSSGWGLGEGVNGPASHTICTRRNLVSKLSETTPSQGGGVIEQVLLEDGTLTVSLESLGLTVSDLLALYRHMAEIRVLDARMLTLQRQGRLGFYLTTYGEEATHVGSTYALEERDYVWPCYRENGAGFVRGYPLEDYVNQCFGNSLDSAKGRQMPNHWGYAPGNLVTISSPVGTQISQAVGGAMASKYLKDGGVVLVFFGDGATSQGDFHVGMNFAGVYKAPCIFLCRNNGYAISVPTHKQTAVTDFSLKALGYGMPGIRVDGNDVLALYKVTKEAAERGRAGEGPTFIEALTYRKGAHSSSDDPSRYRSAEEEREWELKDPVARLRRLLEKEGLWDDQKQEELEIRYAENLKAIIENAERAPRPNVESLFEDVYEELTPALHEQRDGLMNYLSEKEGRA